MEEMVELEQTSDHIKITRTYTNKTIVFERKRKTVNHDTQKQIRLSRDLVNQVEEKLKTMEKHEKEYKNFSSLVRFLLEEWLIQFKDFK